MDEYDSDKHRRAFQKHFLANPRNTKSKQTYSQCNATSHDLPNMESKNTTEHRCPTQHCYRRSTASRDQNISKERPTMTQAGGDACRAERPPKANYSAPKYPAYTQYKRVVPSPASKPPPYFLGRSVRTSPTPNGQCRQQREPTASFESSHYEEESTASQSSSISKRSSQDSKRLLGSQFKLQHFFAKNTLKNITAKVSSTSDETYSQKSSEQQGKYICKPRSGRRTTDKTKVQNTNKMADTEHNSDWSDFMCEYDEEDSVAQAKMRTLLINPLIKSVQKLQLRKREKIFSLQEDYVRLPFKLLEIIEAQRKYDEQQEEYKKKREHSK